MRDPADVRNTREGGGGAAWTRGGDILGAKLSFFKAHAHRTRLSRRGVASPMAQMALAIYILSSSGCSHLGHSHL